MIKSLPPIEMLKQLFEIDQESESSLRWRVSRGKAKAGNSAGCKDSWGYWIICIEGVPYKGHRIVYALSKGTTDFDSCLIDHIDGNKSNNTPDNLRLATSADNGHNMSLHTRSTSGYKGVSWHKGAAKWIAKIMLRGKRIHLGYFINIEDAAGAYSKAAKELHGDFARV